ncbi:2'-5' RNA ligase family protein [Arthrobacter sp. H35-D1]|uniref:2'-5' RNA ligase family protein n=1 Tax=Arthrobacter sp. H35-D1 TaxID=3046202 RepID=UPI0024B89532|nr:2'-5' RNA ligase family protein [Arthrobacter sp. H35-D1]MDJ0312467.1 2'-5' RNA ligase family protein [Arthrobacter sp. H35-D1]
MPGIARRRAPDAPQEYNLGVIISLPPELAAELSARRVSYSGPDAAVVPPHITLVSGRACRSWEDAAAHVRKVAAAAEPFMLSLRGTGTFEPLSPVIYLNVGAGAQACTTLHEQLVTGPLEHLPAFDFHPHLTIAHDLDEHVMSRAKNEMAGFQAEFEVRSVGLFDQVSGGWVLREELNLGEGRKN